MGRSVDPVLMVVLHTVQHGVGHGRLPMDNLTCGQTEQCGHTRGYMSGRRVLQEKGKRLRKFRKGIEELFTGK